MKEVTLTDANFQEETSSGLTLVDFWAPWCSPCRMLGPVIEEIAEEVDIKVGKLNVDENPQISATFGIMSIPTVILLKDGKQVETLIGVRPKQDYLDVIESNK